MFKSKASSEIFFLISTQDTADTFFFKKQLKKEVKQKRLCSILE